MRTRPRVYWLMSLARSGSSVTAYAAASPWRWPVADEIMGPWDRTGEPYRYPNMQAELVELFKRDGHLLTERVVDLANRVLTQIADGREAIISKWPHLRPSPEDFRGAFPEDRFVYLIRNPLHRLNSLHRRGWTGSFGPNQDLLRYRQFAQWWLEQPGRLAYDQLKDDPRGFFAALFGAWGIPCDARDIDTATSYARQNYHASSLERSDRPAGGVLSETEFALPREAFDLYLSDPTITQLMRSMGWSLDPADYGAAAPSAQGRR
ncbi:MAG: hypothetical protein H6811_03145 [Phycisphaeraceae bacterium]|nr:hypothetical protein [Phycisphaeraceae bacterium]